MTDQSYLITERMHFFQVRCTERVLFFQVHCIWRLCFSVSHFCQDVETRNTCTCAVWLVFLGHMPTKVWKLSKNYTCFDWNKKSACLLKALKFIVPCQRARMIILSGDNLMQSHKNHWKLFIRLYPNSFVMESYQKK